MAQPEVIKDIEARVKKSGDTMTGLLKTNGSIENQGEARFSHPTYCPNIEDTAVGIGCAFKASRGHFNQMNVNEFYLPATATTNYESNKILFKSYSGGNNGTYTGVSEIAQINTTGLKVGSSSIGINGYIEGTWLRTTSAGNDKTGDFAIIDDLGWIYKRTPAQVLSDIGAASKSHNHNSKYVKKSGGTMTGNLKVPNLDIANNICGGFIYGETNSLNFRGGNPTTEKYTNLKIAEDGVYIDNQKIYYPGNKPTPADIGAATADHTHSNYAASSHNHSATNITSGTLAVARGGTGQTTLTPAVGTKGVRQIYAGTSDMTAGSTSLATGVIYFVYE